MGAAPIVTQPRPTRAVRRGLAGPPELDQRGPIGRSFSQSGTAGPPRLTSSSAAEAGYIILDDDDESFGSGPALASVGDAAEWFFARDGAHQGPVRLSVLQGMADLGDIDPETLVWKSGMEQWTPASTIVALSIPTRLTPVRVDADASTPVIGVTLPPRPGSGAPDEANLATRKSVLAISSLIMGLFWMFGLGSLSAIVLSAMALRQIARSRGTLTGKRLALAGMIVGIIGLIISGIVLVEYMLKDRWQN